MYDLLTTWWNAVFFDLMDENVLMMFLFGWEIFIMPIGFVLALSYALIMTLSVFLKDFLSRR